MITHLKFVGIPVREQERATRFVLFTPEGHEDRIGAMGHLRDLQGLRRQSIRPVVELSV
jgi:hypothetical protein